MQHLRLFWVSQTIGARQMLRLVLETRVNARRNFCCHRVSTSATRVKNLLTMFEFAVKAPYEKA